MRPYSYRGYWIEKIHSGCWDAYMPAFSGDREDGYRYGDVWCSPAHRTKRAAQAAIDAEIRRINRGVAEALRSNRV